MTPTHTLAEAQALPEGQAGVRLLGVLSALRSMGRLTFAELADGDDTLQLSLARDELPDPEAYRAFTRLPLGARLAVEGRMTRTQKGTLTLQISAWTSLDDPREGPATARL